MQLYIYIYIQTVKKIFHDFTVSQKFKYLISIGSVAKYIHRSAEIELIVHNSYYAKIDKIRKKIVYMFLRIT